MNIQSQRKWSTWEVLSKYNLMENTYVFPVKKFMKQTQDGGKSFEHTLT